MGVFHVFYIVQMVPNRAKHRIFALHVKIYWSKSPGNLILVLRFVKEHPKNGLKFQPFQT